MGKAIYVFDATTTMLLCNSRNWFTRWKNASGAGSYSQQLPSKACPKSWGKTVVLAGGRRVLIWCACVPLMSGVHPLPSKLAPSFDHLYQWISLSLLGYTACWWNEMIEILCAEIRLCLSVNFIPLQNSTDFTLSVTNALASVQFVGKNT